MLLRAGCPVNAGAGVGEMTRSATATIPSADAERFSGFVAPLGAGAAHPASHRAGTPPGAFQLSEGIAHLPSRGVFIVQRGSQWPAWPGKLVNIALHFWRPVGSAGS
jgi:hypothetical protein